MCREEGDKLGCTPILGAEGNQVQVVTSAERGYIWVLRKQTEMGTDLSSKLRRLNED